MQKTIKKISAVVYAVMAVCWSWVLIYCEITRLKYSSTSGEAAGLADIFVFAASSVLLVSSAFLVLEAFSKAKEPKWAKTIVHLIVFGVMALELAVSFLPEVLTINAYQTGRNFFVGTPVALIFDLFKTTYSVLLVSAVNLLLVSFPNEQSIFTKTKIKDYIFPAKTPYQKMFRWVAVIYAAITLLWSILLINVAFVKTPWRFGVANQVLCGVAVVLLISSATLLLTKAFGVKIRVKTSLTSGVLALICPLPIIAVCESGYGKFYESVAANLLGGMSDNIAIKIITSLGFLNLIILIILAVIRLLILGEKTKKVKQKTE